MAVLKPLAKSGYYIWKYLPSLAGALIFTILFFAVTAIHSWRMYKTRLWFCTPIVIGAFMEMIGYAARIACYTDTSKLMTFIIQQMFILLPPVLFAASIYMVLGRIIRALHADDLSIIRPSRLTKTFVAGDIIAFYIQGGGGGLTAVGARSTTSKINFALIGQWVIIGGLACQIIIFSFFCFTAINFQKRYERSLAAKASISEWGEWKQMMNMLYSVSGLIMIRSIFRVVEFAAGADGYLMKNEWPLYIFDTVLMFGVLVIFFFYHPMNIPGLVPGSSNHERVLSMEQGLNPGVSQHDIHLVEQPVRQKF